MNNKQDIPPAKIHPIDLVSKGAVVGLKAGFMLSILYAISGIFIIEGLGLGVGFNSLWVEPFALQNLVSAAPIFLVGWVYIFVVAIIPATILGFLTGGLLGIFAESLGGRTSKYFFVSLCIVLCIFIVILVYLLFGIHVVFSFRYPDTSYITLGIYGTYPFHIGIPTIIYVLTGGWVGWKLYPKTIVQVEEQG